MNTIPRILISAPASGSGKTMFTCGLMRLLQREGYCVQGFKCGPDYIDPMFHTRVLGVPSVNLDSFFVEEDTLRYLFTDRMERITARSGIAVIEGVMGYYDGLAGKSTQASTYDIARITDTSVIFIVDVKGMSLSVVPFIKGFLEYTADSHIQGVVLNRCSKGMYPILKELIESQLAISVVGYVPVIEESELPSRHLGLYLPDEIADLQGKIERIADTLKETINLELLLKLAEDAPQINAKMPDIWRNILDKEKSKVRIAVARDDAFCFYYQDNLELLERLGCRLVPFSPVNDGQLPDDIAGMILGGGYPENFARELSYNTAMRQAVSEAIRSGMPCLAECGGFLYLHESISDIQGLEWQMAGVIPATAAYQGKLQPRFGYITLTDERSGTTVRGHEFHYYDSTEHGTAWTARKPLSKRQWSCMHRQENLLAGFPHLYYASNIEWVAAWVEKCRQRCAQK